MEKPASAFRAFSPRLLTCTVLAILCGTSLNARPSAEQIRSLLFRAVQNPFFVGAENEVMLEIPELAPDKVQIVSDSLSENVALLSSRKEKSLLANGTAGTTIHVWLRFLKPGSYELSPFKVRIYGKTYDIPVQPITVFENPQLIQPELFAVVEQPHAHNAKQRFEVSAATHIIFTVYIRYAVQIVSFSWNIPQNSLFSEICRYEITEGIPRGTEFSQKAEPVARFDWQPLVQGEYEIPSLSVTATAYNGSRIELTLPPQSFFVGPMKEPDEKPQKTEQVFAYAFSEPQPDETLKSVKPVQFENLAELLSLRQSERHSFPFSKHSKKRSEWETAAGLAPGPAEPSVPLFALFEVFSAASLIATVLLFVFKKKQAALWCLICCLPCTCGSILLGMQVCTKTALFAGGEINAIPELHRTSDVTVQAGSRVLVKQQAGSWAYIKYNDILGWVPQNTLYIIQ